MTTVPSADVDDDMPDLIPHNWKPDTTNTTPTQPSLPFPTLIGNGTGVASGPSGLTATWQPNTTTTTTFNNSIPVNTTQPLTSPNRPFIQPGVHVPVPASLTSFTDLVSSASPGHSHSHDGLTPCGHSHSPPPPTIQQVASYPAPASAVSHSDHGHSHGGSPCSGHDHGVPARVSSPTSKSASSRPPIIYDEPPRPRGSYLRRSMNWLNLAWRGGGDSRYVLFYVGMKVGFMLLQFSWGIYQNNLGLVSSSFHTGFDVIALFCSLLAMLNAKYPTRHPYSYGFDRQEIVAAFTNAIFLFFVATFMIIETFHTAYFPPEVERDDIALAGLGFMMDMLGLGLFYKYMTLKSATEPSVDPSSNWSVTSSSTSLGNMSGRGHYENMHGVSLHVLADLVGHVSLLIAVWCVQAYPQATWIFAVSFLLSAILIIQLVLPLFQTTGAILLMTTPASIRLGLDRCIREISFYDGVLELRSAHWWTQSPGVIVGSLHIRIRSDAEEQAILTYVNTVLKKYVTILTVQIEKDQLPTNWMQNSVRSP